MMLKSNEKGKKVVVTNSGVFFPGKERLGLLNEKNERTTGDDGMFLSAVFRTWEKSNSSSNIFCIKKQWKKAKSKLVCYIYIYSDFWFVCFLGQPVFFLNET